MYAFYRTCYFIAMMFPLRFSYGFARVVAGLCYLACARDRNAVIENIRTITGGRETEKRLRGMAKEMYRNFAKYLVDFFRFSKIDKEYVDRFVKIEGIQYLDEALKNGKGAIALSAHIGNWELGGAVLAAIGYPVSAVALTHRDKRIDDFFTRQRLAGRFKPIQMGASLKECYRVLKSNQILGLLGDRDFTKSGLTADFFGKPTLFPRGPSVFAYRLGAPLVPTLVIRQPDDTYRLIFEPPMYADRGKSEEEAVSELTGKCAGMIESYVKKYPTQWYIFRDMWKKDE